MSAVQPRPDSGLAETLSTAAAEGPDRIAVRCGDSQVTYAELEAMVNRASAALKATGIRPGDRLAIMLGNQITFVVAAYAGWRVGAIAVPINTSLTSPEVAFELTDCQARVMVVGRQFAETVQALRGTLPELDVVFMADAGHDVDAQTGMRSWDQALDDQGDAPVAKSLVRSEDLALLAYTSGTSGSPKAAMLTHGQLLANQAQMRDSGIDVTPDDIVYTALPLFHSHGLNVAMALTLAGGGALELDDGLDAVASLRVIGERGVTVLVGAPPMYVAWLDCANGQSADLSTVRRATSAAAPLPPAVLRGCRDELGLDIREGYGLAEAGPVVSSAVSLPDSIPGCVGRPLEGVEVMISDDGSPAQPGDPGRVLVRGPNVFRGYWQAPEATAHVRDADGWLDTGDIGLLDDGLLYLVDRAKDVIIVSGFNVYPAEVEAALVSHPEVVGAAVLGTPHPYTGESITAYLVVSPGSTLTADQVTQHVATRLARFKRPATIEFVDSLPTLPTGKVRRRLLRDA